MKMNELINTLPSLLAGIILGVIFFGGLWLTIQKGLRSKNSALIFVGSFIIRMAIILSGFYFVVQYGWKNMIVCLLGFLIARVAVTRMTKKMNQPTTVKLIKEAQHET